VTDKPKNRGGRPARISRADIIAAARKIPAKELSLSLIARRLGVKTPSLYNHFESRQALLVALSAELATQLKVRAPDPDRWREWMAATAGDLYQFYAANPVILEMESSQLVASVVTPIMEAALETLQKAGFKPVDALLVWSAVVGVAVLEAHSAQMEPGAATATPTPGARRTLAGKSALYPRVRETYALLAKRNPKTLALDLLDEVVALLADPASTTKSKTGGR
jgi:TetR/AcrR family transcriptional regulator, tetracycline repressor protein